MKKLCTVCGEEKDYSEFYKQAKGKCGLQRRCKPCAIMQTYKQRRTRRGCLKWIYYKQVERSKRKGYPPPDYSCKWLVNWGIKQRKYPNYYNAWVESGYNKWLKPSVDRINDYGFYTKDNIQMLTWRENFKKGCDNIRNGINNKNNGIAVRRIINNVVSEFPSISMASRKTGIGVFCISNSCKKNIKTEDGSVWEFINK